MGWSKHGQLTYLSLKLELDPFAVWPIQWKPGLCVAWKSRRRRFGDRRKNKRQKKQKETLREKEGSQASQRPWIPDFGDRENVLPRCPFRGSKLPDGSRFCPLNPPIPWLQSLFSMGFSLTVTMHSQVEMQAHSCKTWDSSTWRLDSKAQPVQDVLGALLQSKPLPAQPCFPPHLLHMCQTRTVVQRPFLSSPAPSPTPLNRHLLHSTLVQLIPHWHLLLGGPELTHWL